MMIIIIIVFFLFVWMWKKNFDPIYDRYIRTSLSLNYDDNDWKKEMNNWPKLLNELKTIIELSNFESLSILSFYLYIHFSISYTQPLIMIIGINNQKCFLQSFSFSIFWKLPFFHSFTLKNIFLIFPILSSHTEYRRKNPEFSESDFRISCSMK